MSQSRDSSEPISPALKKAKNPPPAFFGSSAKDRPRPVFFVHRPRLCGFRVEALGLFAGILAALTRARSFAPRGANKDLAGK